MAIATNPLFSAHASGSVARTLTFRTIGHRPIVSKHPAASKSHTPAQLVIRERTKTIAQTWPTLTQSEKATWTPTAAEHFTSNFNHFFTTNWKRLRDNQTLIKTPTPENAPGLDTFAARTFATRTLAAIRSP